MAALIAGAVKPENAEGIDTLGVSIEGNPKGNAVLFYDTEQSEVQLYKNVSTLLRRCGRDTMPEWFKAYCLTGMSRKERLKSIVHDAGVVQGILPDGDEPQGAAEVHCAQHGQVPLPIRGHPSGGH